MASPASTLQRIAQIVGVVLLLLGILGFFQDPVLGVFEVDALHNIIHLVTGGALFWAGSMGHGPARSTFQTFGVIYAVVTILGFLAPDMLGAIMEVNVADHWLHLSLAVVFLGLGFAWNEGGTVRRV